MERDGLGRQVDGVVLMAVIPLRLFLVSLFLVRWGFVCQVGSVKFFTYARRLQYCLSVIRMSVISKAARTRTMEILLEMAGCRQRRQGHNRQIFQELLNDYNVLLCEVRGGEFGDRRNERTSG
mmetsp:Transcript_1122/g.1773  ORF Transcript_1122/g.1773 Transcript_1122/m.1773 type:complete len:123 (-) Transcript_1122:47-415(-)